MGKRRTRDTLTELSWSESTPTLQKTRKDAAVRNSAELKLRIFSSFFFLWETLPYALAGQHLCGAPSTNPNSEEDQEQSGGEHHLTGVRGRVPDGQGKGHRSSQAWRAQQAIGYI